jgi:hypothetical protein
VRIKGAVGWGLVVGDMSRAWFLPASFLSFPAFVGVAVYIRKPAGLSGGHLSSVHEKHRRLVRRVIHRTGRPPALGSPPRLGGLPVLVTGLDSSVSRRLARRGFPWPPTSWLRASPSETPNRPLLSGAKPAQPSSCASLGTLPLPLPSPPRAFRSIPSTKPPQFHLCLHHP